ncbi:MAG: rhomboid family intramembrane serine protease [Spirochaetia bacterium]|nr:rhomboid family intramembrane serine protease [Spirochaetia bacterium]
MESTALFALIAINVVVSFIGFRALSGPAASNFLFVPFEVARGRNFTGAILANVSHANGAHLLMNMVTLFFFAPAVVRQSSQLTMLLLYVGSGLGAAVAVYLFQRGNPNYRCLGASGSVVGIVFAAIAMDPSITVYLHFAIPIPGPLYAIGYLALSIFFMRNSQGGVSHEAHIGGAVTGIVLTGLLAPHGLWPLIRYVSHFLS